MNATLKYGLIAGLMMAVTMLALYYISLELSQNMSIATIVSIVVPIIFMVLAVRTERTLQGGLISFGEALKTSFFVYMIASIISTVVSFAHMQTYSDETWEEIAEIQKSNASGMMKMFGADELAIDEALDEGLSAEDIKEQTASPSIVLIGLIGAAIFGMIISLIVALIMKRNPTP